MANDFCTSDQPGWGVKFAFPEHRTPNTRALRGPVIDDARRLKLQTNSVELNAPWTVSKRVGASFLLCSSPHYHGSSPSQQPPRSGDRFFWDLASFSTHLVYYAYSRGSSRREENSTELLTRFPLLGNRTWYMEGRCYTDFCIDWLELNFLFLTK